jgi:hypothetical protein
LHKAPILHPFKWRKYVAVGSVAIVIMGSVFYFWPTEGKGGNRNNVNDSILVARVVEANLIVKDFSKSPQRYDDYAKEYVNKLVEAAEKYKSTDTLAVSHDSIRDKGRELWASSKGILDKEYQEFAKREREFRVIEANAAADSFAQRQKDIIMYVSDNIK